VKLPPERLGQADEIGVRPRQRLDAPLKYQVAADIVRDMIADGTLLPGAPAPSGAELARKTGFGILACRQALGTLLADGTLMRGASPTARLRAARRGGAGAGDADALQVALSRSLAGRRHAAGMTQPELAVKLEVSVTTVGHAETGRTWQGRSFWLRADRELGADGDLLRLFDRYKAAECPAPEADVDAMPEEAARGAPALPASVLLTDEEREAVRLAGMLYTLIADHVMAGGPNQESDLAEVRALVHGIQYRVMANAAGRAYPGEFRLLGAALAGRSPAAGTGRSGD